MSDPNVPNEPLDASPPMSGVGYAPTEFDPTAQAAEALRRKQARRNRWAKLGGYIVAALALLRLGIYLLPSAPKACDASETKSAVLDAMNDRYKADKKAFTLASLSNIVTVGTSDKMNQCKALGTFSDNASANVLYNITGDEVDAKVTDDVHPKH